MSRQCELMIGYLIPRRCDRRARSTCIRCGKHICDVHASISPQGILCEACHEGVKQLTTEETPNWVSNLPDYHSEDVALFDSSDTIGGVAMFDDLS
jgi:hypothetical protein